ncbi:exopolysaccharide biosynthesis polyprenyl glycosylphosphotransferase [Sphingomonas sp. MA1305]|uniref:exopolysaccharide biosynthesis polyprenyl glycosylphosphotransferase n=1 Tax=Sphingomonas sp. MA1305 TaxID=2479204 RepID=UPI0018DF75B9|nr:exopolysaccharide biosynthesis polyprenyl glycosylphosphotransferase [Sphingomonas sp. MA1305]MBI0477193.1 exopolysaccharide biosynthesis polyprenyl glycosylphosphotransferase [Sphingomonas sp. MA1305]
MNVLAGISHGTTRLDTVAIANRRHRRFLSHSLLLASDILAIVVPFLIANIIYWGSAGSSHGVTILALLIPAYSVFASLNHTFSDSSLERLRYGAVRSMKAVMLAAMAILLVAYMLKVGSHFSRAVFATGFAGTLIAIPVLRLLLVRRVQTILGGSPFTTVVVVDGVSYNRQPDELVLTATELGFDPDSSDPLGFHRLADILCRADRVVIACRPDHYARWSSILKSMTVDGEIVDTLGELDLIGIGRHAGRQTFVVAAGPLSLGDRIIKRMLDIMVSLIALIMLSPLFAVIAIAIRVESAGPVFFRQPRIGRDNRIFSIYKFRSMFAEACDPTASALTTRSDPRVTRVGDFIRRTSIDELPQLINVMRGTMSIVGPRPHPLGAKAADLLYWDIDPRYRQRHSMKPGMTGLAQIRGFRGNTERVEDLTNRLQSDLEYAVNWSVWRDIGIIFATFAILRHKNAF